MPKHAALETSGEYTRRLIRLESKRKHAAYVRRVYLCLLYLLRHCAVAALPAAPAATGGIAAGRIMITCSNPVTLSITLKRRGVQQGGNEGMATP